MLEAEAAVAWVLVRVSGWQFPALSSNPGSEDLVVSVLATPELQSWLQ